LLKWVIEKLTRFDSEKLSLSRFIISSPLFIPILAPFNILFTGLKEGLSNFAESILYSHSTLRVRSKPVIMSFRLSISSLLLSLWMSTCVYAQETIEPIGGAAYQEKYQHIIHKAKGVIKIDGDLSDTAWQGLEVSKKFAPHWPQDNVPLKRDTEVRMTFDEQFLYVAALCRDSTNKHVIQSLKRDGDYWSSDAFGLVLDPINERTNGFFFGVSVANAQFEDLLTFQTDEKPCATILRR
jgi:hypothetical protein